MFKRPGEHDTCNSQTADPFQKISWSKFVDVKFTKVTGLTRSELVQKNFATRDNMYGNTNNNMYPSAPPQYAPPHQYAQGNTNPQAIHEVLRSVAGGGNTNEEMVFDPITGCFQVVQKSQPRAPDQVVMNVIAEKGFF